MRWEIFIIYSSFDRMWPLIGLNPIPNPILDEWYVGLKYEEDYVHIILLWLDALLSSKSHSLMILVNTIVGWLDYIPQYPYRNYFFVWNINCLYL